MLCPRSGDRHGQDQFGHPVLITPDNQIGAPRPVDNRDQFGRPLCGPPPPLDSQTFLLEVKRPLGVRGGLPEHRNHLGGSGDFTKAQVRWWTMWKGAEPRVVRTMFEALAAIGVTD